MWVFTRHGFFSVICARREDGQEGQEIDPYRLIVKARVRRHLEALNERFPALLGRCEIQEFAGTGHGFCIFVHKTVWSQVLSRLALETDYDNFNSVVARHQWRAGRAYERSEHDVRSALRTLETRLMASALLFELESLSRVNSLEGCGTHGPLCYGVPGALRALREIVIRTVGSVPELSSVTPIQFCELESWQTVLGSILRHRAAARYHTPVFEPRETVDLMERWTSEADSSTNPRLAQFLKFVAPVAVFPPAPMSPAPYRIWLRVAQENCDQCEIAERVDEGRHFAQPCAFEWVLRTCCESLAIQALDTLAPEAEGRERVVTAYVAHGSHDGREALLHQLVERQLISGTQRDTAIETLAAAATHALRNGRDELALKLLEQRLLRGPKRATVVDELVKNTTRAVRNGEYNSAVQLLQGKVFVGSKRKHVVDCLASAAIQALCTGVQEPALTLLQRNLVVGAQRRAVVHELAKATIGAVREGRCGSALQLLRENVFEGAQRDAVVESLVGATDNDGTLALELVPLLLPGDTDAARALASAADAAREGLDAHRARMLLNSECVRHDAEVTQAIFDGIAKNTAEAFRLAQFDFTSSAVRSRAVGSAARAIVQSRDVRLAIDALEQVHAHLTADASEALVQLARSHALHVNDVPFTLRVIRVGASNAEVRRELAYRVVELLSSQDAEDLRSIASIFRDANLDLPAIGLLMAEKARFEESLAFVFGVLENFPIESEAIRESLQRRALELTVRGKNRAALQRFFALPGLVKAAGETAADGAVDWYGHHPAVRKRLLERLEQRAPVERLRAILRYRRNMFFWPVEWAEVDEQVFASLTPEDRKALRERMMKGAPPGWREVGRRLKRSL